MTLNYTSSIFLAAFSIGFSLRAGGESIGGWSLRSPADFVGVFCCCSRRSWDARASPRRPVSCPDVLSAIVYWYVRSSAGRRTRVAYRVLFLAFRHALGLIGSLITGFSAHDARGLAFYSGRRGERDVGAACDDSCLWLRPHAGCRRICSSPPSLGRIAGHRAVFGTDPAHGLDRHRGHRRERRASDWLAAARANRAGTRCPQQISRSGNRS